MLGEILRAWTWPTAGALIVAIGQPGRHPAPFPQPGDRWFLSVRAPERPGWERFAKVYGEPTGDRWTLVVTCGTVSLRTGKERVELQATGDAVRSRRGDMGWTWTPVGGGATGGGGFVREKGLEPDVVMAAPCPSGRGDLSSGD